MADCLPVMLQPLQRLVKDMLPLFGSINLLLLYTCQVRAEL
jgi:hypothetical protein